MSTRKFRGLTQKIFLIETLPIKDESIREYVVMGTSKNVYTVTVQNKPACTCPDYSQRQGRCKHIYFVMMKIMKVKDPDTEKYSNNEIKEMFSRIPKITNTLCVALNIKKKYENYKNKDKYNKNKDTDYKVQEKSTDDLCPICLDDLENGEKLTCCKYGCGKSVHEKCFSMWSSQGGEICIFCRTDWNKDKNKIVKKYINLDE